jgi:hypothetical protein
MKVIINRNLDHHRGKKFSGIISIISKNFVTIDTITVEGESGIILNSLTFKTSADTKHRIQIFGIQPHNYVEFYASVYSKDIYVKCSDYAIKTESLYTSAKMYYLGNLNHLELKDI